MGIPPHGGAVPPLNQFKTKILKPHPLRQQKKEKWGKLFGCAWDHLPLGDPSAGSTALLGGGVRVGSQLPKACLWDRGPVHPLSFSWVISPKLCPQGAHGGWVSLAET